MNIDNIFTFSFILLPIIFSVICLNYALYFLKLARNIEDTPTSKIRSAAFGWVKLSGIIKPIDHLSTVGQLSGEPVAWSRYQVEQLIQQRTENGTESYWKTLQLGASNTPFLLQDDTGEALILPFKAEIIPSETLIWYGSSPIAPKPPRNFWQWLFSGSSGRFRYTEQRLEFGKTIYAQGMFSNLKQHPSLLSTYSSLDKNFPALTAQNTPQGHHSIISATPAARLSRNYKLKAFVFFLGFLVFSAIIVNSTFPVIKQLLQGK